MTDLAELARQLGPEGVKRNPQLFADLTPDERKLVLPHVLGEPTKADIKCEKDLQRDCENLLSHRDYLRMNPLNADAAADISERAGDLPVYRGWFGHLYNTKKNPLFPDLVILSAQNDRRPLFVELKNGKPRWQPGQEAMCYLSVWTLCTDYEEFEIALSAWEQEGQTAEQPEGEHHE